MLFNSRAKLSKSPSDQSESLNIKPSNLNNDSLLDFAHSPSFEKVMYNLNPAVIKSILSNMSQIDFIKNARLIRRKAYSSIPGTNLHAMYINLYQWCRVFYRKRFL